MRYINKRYTPNQAAGSNACTAVCRIVRHDQVVLRSVNSMCVYLVAHADSSLLTNEIIQIYIPLLLYSHSFLLLGLVGSAYAIHPDVLGCYTGWFAARTYRLLTVQGSTKVARAIANYVPQRSVFHHSHKIII